MAHTLSVSRGFTGALLAAAALASMALAGPEDPQGRAGGEPPWKSRRSDMLDKMGGLAESVLAEQSREPVEPPDLDDAAAAAFAAAAAEARPLLEDAYVHAGRTITVPDDFETIQTAIDAAAAGDVVVVRAGVYYELLTMKDGVKLISDDAQDGDEVVAVEDARLRLPRRALRTILDGSRSQPSSHGMIDFEPGSGRRTIVDGFTIRSLPPQDHHVPGHAHGLNVRGASPVIANCLIMGNGSTGIGNHVVFEDQSAPMPERDFRHANIKHEASALIYGNVIRDSLGLAIGCNHFATPFVLGNEMFGNDDSKLGGAPTPAIGAKHGARPTIVGNVIHGNPGGGILCKTGARQGAHPIDRPPRPRIRSNLVYANGTTMPGIACAGAGTTYEPAEVVGNRVYDAGAVGIGASEKSVVVITGNIVARSKGIGISVNGAVVPELSRNGIREPGGPGIAIVQGAAVREMKGNAVQGASGPRFIVRGGTVREPAPGSGTRGADK